MNTIKISDLEEVTQANGYVPIVQNGKTSKYKLNPADIVAEGNLNPVTSNAVANALSYSTDETPTGGYWIDGKPIYRKAGFRSGNVSGVIIDSTLTTSYIQNIIATGGSVFMYSSKVSVGGFSDAETRVCIFPSSEGLKFGSSDGTPQNLYWWIEYTKTETPTRESETKKSGEDKSEDEKPVDNGEQTR